MRFIAKKVWCVCLTAMLFFSMTGVSFAIPDAHKPYVGDAQVYYDVDSFGYITEGRFSGFYISDSLLSGFAELEKGSPDNAALVWEESFLKANEISEKAPYAFNMAVLHYRGLGVTRSYKKALEFLQFPLETLRFFNASDALKAKVVQQAMTDLGLYDGKVDGDFGPESQASLRLFLSSQAQDRGDAQFSHQDFYAVASSADDAAQGSTLNSSVDIDRPNVKPNDYFNLPGSNAERSNQTESAKKIKAEVDTPKGDFHMSVFSILGLAFLILLPISSFLIYHTGVCLHYGRELASEEFLKGNPKGFQDAITDPRGNKWFFLVQGGLIAVIACYFYFGGWLVGFGSILAYFFGSLVIRRFFPPENSPRWAKGIFASMCRREADYKRDGDVNRYEAMKSLREDFADKFMR